MIAAIHRARQRLWAPQCVGLVAIIVMGLACDQLSKAWIVHVIDLGSVGTIRIAPFLALVMVWNPGISFGLLPEGSVPGMSVLIGFALGASILFWLMAVRAKSRLHGVGLALIIAGALGNTLDRMIYGAVADFFYFHIGRFSWYVFNIADIMITLGALAVIIVSLRRPPDRRKDRT